MAWRNGDVTACKVRFWGFPLSVSPLFLVEWHCDNSPTAPLPVSHRQSRLSSLLLFCHFPQKHWGALVEWTDPRLASSAIASLVRCVGAVKQFFVGIHRGMKFDCRTYTNPVLLEPRARKQCDNRVGAGCEGVGILSVFWLLPPPRSCGGCHSRRRSCGRMCPKSRTFTTVQSGIKLSSMPATTTTRC